MDRAQPALSLFRRGFHRQQAGDLEGAIQAYRRSIALFPTAEAHTFLGWAYSFQDRIEEAVEECRKAIEVDPELGNPYNDIGVYMIRMGREEEAIPWLEKAKRAPRYAVRCYPYFNMGNILERRGMLREALAEYTRALELEPDYAMARVAVQRLREALGLGAEGGSGGRGNGS